MLDETLQGGTPRVNGAVMDDLVRRAAAEGLGTFLLVLLGVGSAVFGIDAIGPVGVALAFGLTLLALAYALGPVSGCHVNPAVTLGVLLRRGITAPAAGAYWVAQVVGGLLGAAVLALLVSDFGGVTDQTGALGSNGWGATVDAGGAFVIEALLTFVLVLVILLVTGRAAAPGFAGLAIGLTLAVVHLVAIPLTGTSVNPARSLGPALLAGGDALGQVWLFIVAPLVGGAVAALVAPPLQSGEELLEVAAGREGSIDLTGADVPSAMTTGGAAGSGPVGDAVDRPPRRRRST
jgi:aquaporin Z